MKILIVDDDPVIGNMMRRVLEADGYQVAHALTLAEARQAPGPFNAVLADIRLPNGDGRHLQEWYPGVPFISMSGYHGELPDLPKPFSPLLLRKKMREVTGRDSLEQSPS